MRIVALGDRDPSFLTHREVDATLALMPDGVDAGWVATDAPSARSELDRADGIWLLPGSPYRDETVAYGAIERCLATATPFLGTCAGFQYAAVVLARRIAGLAGAGHAESDPDAEDLVIVPLGCTLYGETRIVCPVTGTRLAAICSSEPFEGFHWCGFGLADSYRARLEQSGVTVSAYADDAGAEAIELPDHPFFIATAFQPQVGSSRECVVHPLIEAFLDASARPRVRQDFG